MQPSVRVTVIVEWYNLTHAEASRARRLLSSVRERATAMQSSFEQGHSRLYRPVELIIAHDADRTRIADIGSFLGPSMADSAVQPRLLALPDATYCRLKNAAALVATGDVVIFLDCDVIPEPGWLETLVSPFADPEVAVVVGNTYVDCEDGGTYARTMALTWMFALRDARSSQEAWGVSSIFYANNVAFRRSTFLSRPFSDTPGLTHYAASLMVERLQRDGIPIWYAPARAAHPPPNGLAHFFSRAVAGGRARALTSPEQGFRRWLRWARIDAIQAAWGWKRLVTQGPLVNLRAWQLPRALFTSGSYVLCFFLGSVATDAFPSFMRHRFVL